MLPTIPRDSGQDVLARTSELPEVVVLHVFEAGGGVEFFIDQLMAIDIDGVVQRTLRPKAVGGAEQSAFGRMWRSIGLGRRMRSEIRKSPPDVVHLHGSFTSWFWVLAPKQRMVYTSHAWPSWKYGLAGSLWRLAAQLIGRGHDTYAALSRAELDEALRLGYDTPSVTYVGSTVPFESCDRRTASDSVALFVGRPGFQKGSELLPAIAAELHGEIPICAMGIDIDGPGFQAVRDRNFDQLLAEATVLIQPSRYEGLSLAALRAAVSGIPIVAFDSPGASWIEEFGAGILVATGDVEAFAGAIRSVARGEFSIEPGALRLLRDHFSAPSFGQRLRDTYVSDAQPDRAKRLHVVPAQAAR